MIFLNRTSAWVFSCKFAAYFQDTFPKEHLWVAASAYMHYIDNHIQNRCSKKSRKLHEKTTLMESLLNTAAGLRPAILLKRHFNTGAFL